MPRPFLNLLYGLCSGLLVASTALGADITVHIESFGLYRLEGVEHTQRADQTSGSVYTASRKVFLQQTDRVPLTLGTAFGVSFVVEAPGRSTVRLRSITRYPSPGLTNPKTGTTGLHDEVVITVPVGKPVVDEFLFSYEWELVPGVWVWQLWDGEKKLAEKSFVVVRPGS